MKIVEGDTVSTLKVSPATWWSQTAKQFSQMVTVCLCYDEQFEKLFSWFKGLTNYVFVHLQLKKKSVEKKIPDSAIFGGHMTMSNLLSANLLFRKGISFTLSPGYIVYVEFF